MEWTQAAMGELARLWDEGHSAAEIGRRMGCGKNAVIGKAHRLGLPSRTSPVDPAARTAQATARRAQNLADATRLRAEGYSGAQIARQVGMHPDRVTVMLRAAGLGGKPAQPRVMPVRVVVPVEPPAPIAAHPLLRAGATGCRWPMGEPRTPGFRFCDAVDVVLGKPYCGAHCARAYVRLSDYVAEPFVPFHTRRAA